MSVWEIGWLPLVNKLNSKEKHPLVLEYFGGGLRNVDLHQFSTQDLFDDYTYRSSYGVSESRVSQLKAFAKENQYGKTDSYSVLEVACNDGYLLNSYASDCKEGERLLIGVDPSQLIEHLAKGVIKVRAEFNSDQASIIQDRYGAVDVVHAHNVFAHTRDLNDFLKGLSLITHDQSLIIIEVQYLLDNINKVLVENFYHEHNYYLSATSICGFMEQIGFLPLAYSHSDIQGGSMMLAFYSAQTEYNLAFQHKKSIECRKSIDRLEKDFVFDLGWYEEFFTKVKMRSRRLKEYIEGLQGSPVIGYFASAKAATLLNLANIDYPLVDKIYDDNPIKIGNCLAGTDIPILGPSVEEMVDSSNPILVLSGNLYQMISQRYPQVSFKNIQDLL